MDAAAPPPSAVGRLALLTGASLVFFAANSLLCRGALGAGRMDPAGFTAVRLASGAVVLQILAGRRAFAAESGGRPGAARAAALFAYAALFSWAYVRLPASVGALVLFGSVQVVMIGWALRRGEGPRGRQWPAVLLALAGLVALTLPGATGTDAIGLLAMCGSGAAWGVYSLLGRGARSPVALTAAAFRGSVLPAAALAGVAGIGGTLHGDGVGLALAVASGAVASGLGYVLWYAAMPSLGATRAAIAQLAVPVLAALGGIVFLGESVTARLVGAGAAVLGGVALAVVPGKRSLRDDA